MRKLLVTILVILTGGAIVLALGSIITLDRVIPGVKIPDFSENHTFVLKYGNREWKLNTADWNLEIDRKQTVEKALKVGRGGNLVQNWQQRYLVWKNGYWVEPIYSLNQEKLDTDVEKILTEIEIPAMDPQISLDSNGKVKVDSGQNGIRVDKELLLTRIKNNLFEKEMVVINIPAVEVRPAISEEQVKMTQERAQKMIGKRVEVINPTTKQKWTVSDKEILFWLNPGNEEYKNEQIVAWLNELAPSVNKSPQNASFTIVANNKLENFKPEVWGVALNTPGSFEKMSDALNKLGGGDKVAVAELVLVKIAPEVTLSEVSNLGLKELLGRGESWFSGSITNRIYNLKKASSELSGVIVPPGETFSFNKQIGEISSDTGYKQAYVIKEGKTILGDGGGVCQVSSTLFRAALAAGLPIVERTAHAYRVHYYEEKYQVGFDATIFQPSPDFKFKNDTPSYLLIQTVYDEKAKYLAFEIYGTTDGRIVELSKSRMWDQIPPPPDLYIDDPNLPLGKVVQTEHSAWGAKAAFDYKVIRGDEVLQDRTFVSVYRPWQAVFQRGAKI